MSKHLEIKQTAVQENVSSAVIDKLYNLTYEDPALGIGPVVDSQRGDIVGNIVSPTAFEDAVEFLRNKFGPDVENNIEGLNIDVINNNYYLRLKDPIIENILVNTYGDGTGVTRAQLAAVTDAVYYDKRLFNTIYNLEFLNAESYDDLQYFTGITSGDNFMYLSGNTPDSYFTETASYASNVKVLHKTSFTAPSITITLKNTGNAAGFVRGANWSRKLQFDNVDISKLRISTSIKDYLFYNVDVPFENIKFPTYSELPICFFYANNLLTKFIYPEGVKKAIDGFGGCPVSYIEYPVSLETLAIFDISFRQALSRTGCMVFKSVNPPQLITDVSTTNSSFHSVPPILYCPANSVTKYQLWAESIVFSDSWTLARLFTGGIKSMAEMSSAEREKGTVTQEDIDRV